MYVCDHCFAKQTDLIRGAMTAVAPCEWCGHFRNDWSTKRTQWTKNVRRPIDESNPKRYILDQLKRPDPPGHLVEVVHEVSRDTATRMRDFMDGFRRAHAGDDDPYKQGWHDALDFMIRQIDQDLERASA